MTMNVIPLRAGAKPLSSIHPAGQALSVAATDQVVADYRLQARVWMFAALGLGLVAALQYRAYVVKPARAGAKKLAAARSALG